MARVGALAVSLPARSEVWWCETPHFPRRPVVLLSRSVAVHGLRRVLVAPCTTTVRDLPSEVRLTPGEDPVPRPCVANLDTVESVSVGTLVERVGRLGDTRMREMCRALSVAVDCG